MHLALSVHHLYSFVTRTTFQGASVGEQKSLPAFWFLEDQAVTYPFAEEEVPGNLCFPSGAHSCFSECFTDSCSQPSVAQPGMLLGHRWIRRWWLGLGALSASLVQSSGALPLAGLGVSADWGWGINGCSSGCSRPVSAFHKLSEITCLIWNNSLAFPDLRQTLDLTGIRFCCVCVYVLCHKWTALGAMAERGSVWFSGERFAFIWEEWIKCPRFRAEANRGWLLFWRNVRQSCCLPCLSQPQGLENPLWSLKLLSYIGSVSQVLSVQKVSVFSNFQFPGRMLCVFLRCLCFDKDLWRTVLKTHCLKLTTDCDHQLDQIHLPGIDSPLLLQLP